MEFVRVEPPGADLAVVRQPARAGARRKGASVFLPGLGDAASAFAPAFESEALARHDVVLVDLLGHGQSDKPEEFDYAPASHAAVLFQALRKLRPAGPLHLVGYSFGGAVAVELARFPVEGLASVILVEPALDAGLLRFASRIAEHTETDFERKYPAVIANYATAESSEADRRWSETAVFASARAIYRCSKGLLQAAKRGELVAHLKELARPRAFILSHETYEEWPLVKEFEKAGARVFLVDAPHKMPFYDSPDSFYSAVARAAESSKSRP